MAFTVPSPRSSPDAPPVRRTGPVRPFDAVAGAALARWYERELGWATEGRAPVRLLTGLRFDVLVLPAEAGHAVLRSPVRTGPALLSGDRVGLLIAAGGADELPGLLDWLEWGPIPLGLAAVGAGGRIPAPAAPGGAGGSPGAALWLRPPEPGRAPEPLLPALAGFGNGGGAAPDLVRLVDAAATECHRVRLSRARAGRYGDRAADQPLAFS
ncbi:hypothetical protein EES43_12240 [Streptomyces sp. ADI96-02]|uniref:SCO3374 family protein n=1 Tax=Streptomyces sp. ADI96-02 TaxID=1522760 RepID=UPI000F54FF40|nr:SCO3374 family protein [Streptomyces sp. ADI96-02]RPK63057.1 hypothetical protein EES43_12240 [Streptomyces sp. ADI96-02]